MRLDIRIPLIFSMIGVHFCKQAIIWHHMIWIFPFAILLASIICIFCRAIGFRTASEDAIVLRCFLRLVFSVQVELVSPITFQSLSMRLHQ